jgi:hypothetical protein
MIPQETVQRAITALSRATLAQHCPNVYVPVQHRSKSIAFVTILYLPGPAAFPGPVARRRRPTLADPLSRRNSVRISRQLASLPKYINMLSQPYVCLLERYGARVSVLP